MDVRVDVHLRAAPSPAEDILLEAEESDCDLLVLGRSIPPRRIGPHDAGWTSQVLRRTPRPVLVVPFREE